MIKPTNFAEAMRALMAIALFGGGVVCTGFAIWLVLIVMGEWPAELAGKRLDLIGKALLASLVGIGLVIVALAVGGPLGRVKASILGNSFEAEGDN